MSNDAPQHGDSLAFDLADRMRKALRNAHMGVGDMADWLQVSRNTIGNYVNGHTEPPRAVLIAWASRTAVPLEWLETGAIPPAEPAEPERSPSRWRRRRGDRMLTHAVLGGATPSVA